MKLHISLILCLLLPSLSGASEEKLPACRNLFIEFSYGKTIIEVNEDHHKIIHELERPPLEITTTEKKSDGRIHLVTSHQGPTFDEIPFAVSVHRINFEHLMELAQRDDLHEEASVFTKALAHYTPTNGEG